MSRKTPIRNDELEDARRILVALQKLPGYMPHNPNYRVESLVGTDNEIVQLREELLRANAVRAQILSKLDTSERRLYYNTRGGAQAAKAQFGEDSDILRALGLVGSTTRRSSGTSAAAE